MNLKNIIESLHVAKYSGEDAYCSAEHDIIFFPLQKDDPSPEDAARLEELGALKPLDEFDTWMTYV
jgi:hypothetical protein